MFTFKITNCSEEIKKIDMIKARDWWFLGKEERRTFLDEIDTFHSYDKKKKKCRMLYNNFFKDVDLIFIIHFENGSFLDVRMFKINHFTLKRNRIIQYHFKDKDDLIKNSSAFDFLDVDGKQAVQFKNIKFLH